MYTCILLGGNGRDNQTKTEDITHTNIFNKVLLRGEVVDKGANGGSGKGCAPIARKWGSWSMFRGVSPPCTRSNIEYRREG